MAEEDKELLETLADLEHQQWAHWTRYFLTTLQGGSIRSGFCIECGSDTPGVHVEGCNMGRWERQVNTMYAALSEKEKDSDREWAQKVLDVLDAHPDTYTKRLEARLRKAEEALLFYRDGANQLVMDADGRGTHTRFDADRGDVARLALNDDPSPEKTDKPGMLAVCPRCGHEVTGVVPDPSGKGTMVCLDCRNTILAEGVEMARQGLRALNDAYAKTCRHDFPPPHNIPFPKQDGAADETMKKLRIAFNKTRSLNENSFDYSETEMRMLGANLEDGLAKCYHASWGKEVFALLDAVEAEVVLPEGLKQFFNDIRSVARTPYRDLSPMSRAGFLDHVKPMLDVVASYASRMVVVQTKSITEAYAARERHMVPLHYIFYDYDQIEMPLREKPKTDVYPKRTPVNEAKVFVMSFSNLTRNLELEIKGIRLRTCQLCGALTTSTTWKCKTCEHADELLDQLHAHTTRETQERDQDLKQRDAAHAEVKELRRRVENIEQWVRGGYPDTMSDTYPKELKPG